MAPPPSSVIPADKIAEMNNILTHVVTEGTGRAAQLPGIVAAGKTGTTNNSTNAWFNGFTGNLVCSVWFGNDDNAPMENLTGGILPAMTWHDIMLYAHQGLDIKPSLMASRQAQAKLPEVAAADPSKNGAAPVAPRAAGLSTPVGPNHHRDRRTRAVPTRARAQRVWGQEIFVAQTSPNGSSDVVAGSSIRR